MKEKAEKATKRPRGMAGDTNLSLTMIHAQQDRAHSEAIVVEVSQHLCDALLQEEEVDDTLLASLSVIPGTYWLVDPGSYYNTGMPVFKQEPAPHDAPNREELLIYHKSHGRHTGWFLAAQFCETDAQLLELDKSGLVHAYLGPEDGDHFPTAVHVPWDNKADEPEIRVLPIVDFLKNRICK